MRVQLAESACCGTPRCAHNGLVNAIARAKFILAKDLKNRSFGFLNFSAEAQVRIEQAVERNPRLAELTQNFPALLMVVVDADDANPAKHAAIAEIEAGATVFDVASTFGLARWTSHLAPAAVSAPMPHVLPDDPQFNAEVLNFLPADPELQRPWLLAMAAAHAWGGHTLALWLARQMKDGLPPPPADALQLIALYQGVSQVPHTLPARMMQKRWHAKQSFHSAAFETYHWLHWVIIHALLGTQGQRQNWRENGLAQGYRFIALQTAIDFKGAAERSDNCLYKYAENLLREWGNRVFDIVEDESGALTGHVEIGFDVTHGVFLRPMQIRDPRNRALSDDVTRAVYAWLASAPSKGPMPDIHVRGDVLLERMSRDRLPSVPNVRVAENWQALFAEFIAGQGVPAGMGAAPTMLDIVTLRQRSGALKDLASELDATFDRAVQRFQRLLDRVQSDN